MAQNTTVVWAQFPSHEAAEKLKGRLMENDFARNSIEIYRNTDGSCDNVGWRSGIRLVSQCSKCLSGWVRPGRLWPRSDIRGRLR
jgi:hypothetical protein